MRWHFRKICIYINSVQFNAVSDAHIHVFFFHSIFQVLIYLNQENITKIRAVMISRYYRTHLEQLDFQKV